MTTPATPATPAPVPTTASLARLRNAAGSCRACGLYENATQAVFGEGSRQARVMLIGEQPGDIEDRQGQPFVGPAGRLLDRAFDDAQLSRSDVYLTNAVKHFKFRRLEGGKRRIHQKPDVAELAACRPWLEAELRSVRPQVVVLLGATAARTLLGPKFRVTRYRGQPLSWSDVRTEFTPPESLTSDSVIDPETRLVATVHPSSVLRADNRAGAYADFLADLRTVADLTP